MGGMIEAMRRVVVIGLLALAACAGEPDVLPDAGPAAHDDATTAAPDGGPRPPDDATTGDDDATTASVDATTGDDDATTGDAGARGDAGTSTVGPVLKSDGTTPADFSCLHRFTDGPAGAVRDRTVRVGVMTTRDRRGERFAAADIPITLIDPVTGAPTGQPAFRTDANGNATIPLAESTRVAWKIEAGFARPCDPCVDTYEYNRLVRGDALEARAVEIDLFFGLSPTTGASTAPKVYLTVVDCAGDPVMNARTDLPICRFGDPARPCVSYLGGDGFQQDPRLPATTGAGRFYVAPAQGGPLSITVRGSTVSRGAELELGRLDVVTATRAAIFGTITPLAN